MNLEAVDLNSCVNEIIRDIGGKAGEIGLITDLEHGLPKVGAFRERLKEIIMELLANSARAVEGAESPEVVITSNKAAGGAGRPGGSVITGAVSGKTIKRRYSLRFSLPSLA